MNDCTCIIAAHISSMQRLRWLCQAVDSATNYFPTILSVSYVEQVKEELKEKLEIFPCEVLLTSERKTQFQHIASVAKHIATKYVIFLDDDDYFLDSISQMMPLLLERYGQHEGVQKSCCDGEEEVQEILCDFSGTFCPTSLLFSFLETNREDLDIYDCDCIFREVVTEGGRGMPNYVTDFGIDADVVPFVYRRLSDLEPAWGK